MKLFIVKPMLVLLFLAFALPQIGCKKQDEWLDVKRNKADVVPETLSNFQAMLDNTTALNNTFTLDAALGTDNVYINSINLNASPEDERKLYLWNKSLWSSNTSNSWNNCFTVIEYANIVLDGLAKNPENSIDYNSVKGQALLWRAYANYFLAQTFGKPYNSATSTSELGIPIRTSSDVNIISKRSSIKDTYSSIIGDIVTAIDLLPSTAKYNTRPNRTAALIIAGRIYLSMQDYTNAYKYSNLAIKENGALLDFNSSIISTNLTYRFPSNGQNNPEVQFLVQGTGYLSLTTSTINTGFVDTTLYNSYNNNDLRKTTFFARDTNTGLYKIRGSYTGNNIPFCGVSTNEAYFIRSECYARLNQVAESMQDLNAVLRNRFKAGTFIPFSANDPEDALRLVLAERRKELAYNGILRWEDLRRLNQDSRFAKAITRTLDGTIYTLLPNDPRYTLSIPDAEIQLTGIEQNIR